MFDRISDKQLIETLKAYELKFKKLDIHKLTASDKLQFANCNILMEEAIRRGLVKRKEDQDGN
jgi:hypothetical protein